MISRFYTKINSTSPAVQKALETPSPQRFTLSGFLSPSGQLTVGYVPRQKRTRRDSTYELKCSRQKSLSVSEYVAGKKVLEKVVHVSVGGKGDPLGSSSVCNHHSDLSGFLCSDSKAVVLEGLRDWQRSERYLNSLEDTYNSGKVKRRNGLKGITKNGRKKVKEGCYLLQKRYGRRIGFYTLTCPYTIPELIYSFNKDIAEISRRFFQDCKRLYEAEGCTWSNVFVYEYQDNRYERDGIPVLHLHYVAPCYYPGTTEFIISATEIRYLWMRSIAQVIGIEADTSASVDAQVIKKTCAGYISKYLSKGGDTVSFLSEVCPSQVPSQWFGMTKNVRDAIKKCTTAIPYEICLYLMQGGGSNEGEVLYTPYRRYIDIPIGYDPVTDDVINYRVGMSARMSAEGIKALQTWNKSALMEL